MGNVLSESAIRVNHRGLPVGESHPNAKLSDDAVKRLVFDRIDPSGPQLSWRALAEKYGCSVRSARDYVDGYRRASVGTDSGRVSVKKLKIPKHPVQIWLPLYLVKKLRNLGGSAWVTEKILKE